MPAAAKGRIRAGIGGWTYEPWRGTFYPRGLPHKRELEFASRRLTSIEVNGTYYRTLTADSFVRWHEETPEDFVFSLKGPRYATNRRVLAEAGPSIERFFGSGVMALGEKLGPINWQFLPTKKFDPDDFEAFLELLPSRVEGRSIRHVVEVRHASFLVPEFIALLRARGIGVVLTDKETFPRISDLTVPFVYLRLQCASEDEKAGYPARILDLWAERARIWASGGAPGDLEHIASARNGGRKPRDVFVYVIDGFKPKAPHVAMALLERF